ncbi:hypothetical protein RF55_15940 [Lasius niger]|uniref:Uncharacterized protein n=1 Tax=Lasius niger TaxID=67767 RepID=A0A0J7MYH0_LASNI|nr:hypothetical protein RF55_15940 [Lasius niger]
MVHYPSILPQSGALVNLACDRFEANHQPAVQDAKATRSRKNVAYTLAIKQQLRCAYRFMARKGLYTILEVGPEEKSDYCNSLFLPISCSNGFMQHALVIFKGTLYKKGMCVTIGVDDDNRSEFGISSIWATMGRQNKPPPLGHWRKRRGLVEGRSVLIGPLRSGPGL